MPRCHTMFQFYAGQGHHHLDQNIDVRAGDVGYEDIDRSAPIKHNFASDDAQANLKKAGFDAPDQELGEVETNASALGDTLRIRARSCS